MLSLNELDRILGEEFVRETPFYMVQAIATLNEPTECKECFGAMFALKTLGGAIRRSFIANITSEKIQFGAIESEVMTIDGCQFAPPLAASKLFSTDYSMFEDRLVEIGMGEFLDASVLGQMKPNAVAPPLVEALGASDAEIITFNSANNEAWFLSVFLWYRFRILGENSSRTIVNAISMGRLIEWWRWRCEHFEESALNEKKRKSVSGKASAKASKNKKEQRIESLLFEVENIRNNNSDFGLFGENAIVSTARKKAAKKNPKLWSVGDGQSENYSLRDGI